MKKTKLVTLIRVAVLIALEIILSRFCSINTLTIRIGFGFVPIALCGILFGPVWAGAAGGIADLLGTFITPYGIYPPITLTAILTGISFGLFLHGKNAKFFPNAVLCTLVNTVGLSLMLQSFWLSIISNTPYYTVFVSRLFQCGALSASYLIILPLLQKLAPKLEHLK